MTYFIGKKLKIKDLITPITMWALIFITSSNEFQKPLALKEPETIQELFFECYIHIKEVMGW